MDVNLIRREEPVQHAPMKLQEVQRGVYSVPCKFLAKMDFKQPKSKLKDMFSERNRSA